MSGGYVDVVDEYEGGDLCTVTALGSVGVDGQMARGDAIMSATNGEVEIVELDFNRHCALALDNIRLYGRQLKVAEAAAQRAHPTAAAGRSADRRPVPAGRGLPAGRRRLVRRLPATQRGDAAGHLRELGMAEGDIPRIAELAVADPYANPRPVTPDGIQALLRTAWAGEAPTALQR